jgi:hypothetical protein
MALAPAGVTNPDPNFDLYERQHLAAANPVLGVSGCSLELSQISDNVNAACCPDGGCRAAVPPGCSAVSCLPDRTNYD